MKGKENPKGVDNTDVLSISGEIMIKGNDLGYWIIIPYDLDVNYLKEILKTNVDIDRVLLYIHIILFTYLYDEEARYTDRNNIDNALVYVHSGRLKEIYSNYKLIIDLLTKKGIIELRKSYSKLLYPSQYGITDNYLKNGIKHYYIKDKKT
mgnify:CR=1 FL=1